MSQICHIEQTAWRKVKPFVRLLRTVLKPRTWVPKASTLSVDHRNRWICLCSRTEIVGVKSGQGLRCLSVMIVVCCQVEVCATDWSLVQRSSTECGVSEYDSEAWTMRRPWSTAGCCIIIRKTRRKNDFDGVHLVMSWYLNITEYISCINNTNNNNNNQKFPWMVWLTRDNVHTSLQWRPRHIH